MWPVIPKCTGLSWHFLGLLCQTTSFALSVCLSPFFCRWILTKDLNTPELQLYTNYCLITLLLLSRPKTQKPSPTTVVFQNTLDLQTHSGIRSYMPATTIRGGETACRSERLQTFVPLIPVYIMQRCLWSGSYQAGTKGSNGTACVIFNLQLVDVTQ